MSSGDFRSDREHRGAPPRQVLRRDCSAQEQDRLVSRFEARLAGGANDAIQRGPASRGSRFECQQDRGRRVLIVDHHRDTADTLAVLLRLHGHAVRVVYDGRDALHEGRDFHPDAALIDVGMPWVNGYDVTRALASRVRLLIAMTPSDSDDVRQACEQAGCHAQLAKPLDLRRLASLLRKPGTA